MKVLIFTSDLYQGGVAESTRKLADYLSKENDVTVCTYDNLPINKFMNRSVKISKLNLPLSAGFRKNKISILTTKLLRFVLLPLAFIKFYYIVMRTSPEVVFSLTYIPNIISVHVCKLLGVKCVVSERQDPIQDLDQGTIFSKILINAYRKATGVHVNSQGMIVSVKKFYKISDEKILNFDNFFIKDDIVKQSINKLELNFSFKKEKIYLVTSGRLSKQKGQWHLLDIMKELIKIDDSYQLLILGEGELRSELEYKIKSQNLSDHVYLLGNVNNPHNFINKSDVFIFPSIWESFGNSLVEAMALGIPVASTICDSGPGEIINYGEYGYNMGIFPSYEEGQLDKDKLQDLVSNIHLIATRNKSLYSEMSLNGYKRYDLSVMSQKIDSIFKL